jgi:signal transduction histidine kinase
MSIAPRATSVRVVQTAWRVPLPVTGVLLSLWRAAALFRAVALVVCVYLIIRWHGIYAHPDVAYGTGAAMIAVTAVVAWLAVNGRAHRPSIVAADLTATVLLTLASGWAQTSSQRHGGMPTLTTIWAAGPVIEAAFIALSLGGVVAGCIQLAAAMIVRSGYDGRTLASGVLLVLTGAIIGYVTALTVRGERDLAVATAAQARVAERERLSRSIHDGVLQVLGLVHRAGRDAGGHWAELGAAAAEQETALRALLTSRPVNTRPGRLDLAGELRMLHAERVTVSVPGEPIIVDAAEGSELVAAVRAALTNVAQHAGPDACSWVLLERLDGRVRVTVRDDGVGIPDGRLEAAEAEGRFGVAGSIRRRVESLGGQVMITSAPGEGTLVEIVLPLKEDLP